MSIESPQEWEVKELHEILDKQRYNIGKIQQKSYLTEGKFPVIDQGQRFIAGYHDDESYVYDGELPIIIFGDHTRIFKFVDFSFILGADGTQLIKPKNFVNPKYLYYALQNTPLVSRGYNRHFSILKKKKILVPPLVEQRGIAEVLGVVDEAILVSEQVIEKTELLKQGLMQRLLTEGIAHTEYKETPIGRIPETWKLTNLEEIVSIIDCKHYTPEYVEEGIPIIRTNDIKPEYLTFETANRVSEQSYQELISRHVPRKGDIVYSREGSFGKASLAVSDELFCIGQRVVIIHPKKIDSYFLFFSLNSPHVFTQVLRNSIGTTARRINVKDIKSLKIFLPPLSEQENIASILHILEKKLYEEKEKQDNVIKIKKGLMQVLLSGQKRVKLLGNSVVKLN